MSWFAIQVDRDFTNGGMAKESSFIFYKKHRQILPY